MRDESRIELRGGWFFQPQVFGKVRLRSPDGNEHGDWSYASANAFIVAINATPVATPSAVPAIMRDVAEFLGSNPDQPAPLSRADLLPRSRNFLWRALIREEQRELAEAMAQEDIVAIAHEATDLVYVTVGMMVESGIPFDRVWREVHAANMRKVDPTTGEVRHREDGKILKPEGWTPADVAAALFHPTQPEPAEQVARKTCRVPEGWMLVPAEATFDMCDAAVGSRSDVNYGDIDKLWATMLAATPDTPASTPCPADRDAMASVREAVDAAVRETRSAYLDDGEEIYQAGKQDGYAEAVQDIDRLTGGDGEYVCSIGAPSDRHCPDATSMKLRIMHRFRALKSTPSLPAQGEGTPAEADGGGVDLAQMWADLQQHGTTDAENIEAMLHEISAIRTARSVSWPGGEVPTAGTLLLAARRYMSAVAHLGQNSGHNGQTFFEVPLLSSPEDIGSEAILRWQELDAAGKALTSACDAQAAIQPPVPAKPAERDDGDVS